MKANSHWHNRYEFGDFFVDAEHLMLYKDGEELDLPPKAVETLLALLERQNEVVSKDELMAVIWADTVVEESNLSRYIHLLRHTLGNRQDGREFIETLRRRGYRINCDARIRKVVRDGSLTSGRIEEDPDARKRETTERETGVPATAAGKAAAISAGQVSRPRNTRSALMRTGGRIRSLRGRAVLFAAVPLVVLFIVVVVFLGRGSDSATLSDRDIILVADFDNRTGDPVFDGTLRQGLVMQLQQSPFLSMLPFDEIQSTLSLMRLPEDIPLSRSVARELCVRRGLKAFVTGSIVSMGEDYVITLEAVGAGGGESLAIQQVQASGKEGVLRALSSAASSLRARLGEELSAIKKSDTPLEVSTRSLEALRFHTLAWKETAKGNSRGAIPYFLKAIEIDPEFASAYGDLAVSYRNIGLDVEAVTAIKKAFELSQNTSELERLNITDLYHAFVTYQLEERLKILTTYRRLYPRDYRAALRLASIYLVLGDYEKTIEQAKDSVRLGSSKSYYEWGVALIALGRYDEAKVILEKAVKSGYLLGEYHESLAEIGAATDDNELVRREMEELETGGFVFRSARIKARLALIAGQVNEGLGIYRDAVARSSGDGLVERSTWLAAEMALAGSYFGMCSAVTSLGVEHERLLEVQGAAADAALALANCGHTAEAKRLSGELIARYPEGTYPHRLTEKLVRGAIALTENRPEETVRVLSEVPPGIESRSNFKVGFLRGQAMLKLQKFKDAEREFRKITANRGESPLSQLFPLAFLGCGRALRGLGRTEEAREEYKRFLSLWRDADEDLADVISAKRELAALN